MLKSWADETAADLFSRTAFPGLDLLPGLPAPGLRVGETLELCGEPSTGKTALLMEAAVRCAMPAEVGGIAIGGAESHVIVVDCDGGFDVLRLASSIRARLAAAVPDQRAVEAASRAALQRVRLMQCTTCRELLIGLCRVRAELETPASGGATLTATTRPRLLLIDGVSAFQWMERGERRHSAVDDCRADGIEARVGVLVGLLRRQRLSIAWSRCPLRTRGGGLDFPIVDKEAGGVSLHHELSRPTMRWKLRRRAEAASATAGAAAPPPTGAPPAAAGAAMAARTGSTQPQAGLQALLDSTNLASTDGLGARSNAVAPGSAPERRDLVVIPHGVCLA